MRLLVVVVLALMCLMSRHVSALSSRRRKREDMELDDEDFDTNGSASVSLSPETLTVASFLQEAEDHVPDASALGCGQPFSGEVLAYVTPWNGKGYDEAKTSAARITWLAPVWFQIRGTQGGGVGGDALDYSVTGEHDVDVDWVREVWAAQTGAQATPNYKRGGSSKGVMKVVPRVTLETPMDCPTAGKDDECRAMALELNRMRQLYGFDGYTLEIPLEHWKAGAVISALLKHMGAYVVYVIPPLDADPDTFDYEGYAGFFAVFEGSVDRWSVMTYDANRGTGRPNAPFEWQAGIITGLAQLTTNRKQLTRVRNKLLMGLPMYGWRSDGEAMTSGALVDWLTGGGQGASVRWDEDAKEHQFSVFTSGGGGQVGHTVTASYPTMSFLCARLRLAEEEGIAGVALWEIGQPLPSLMEAF